MKKYLMLLLLLPFFGSAQNTDSLRNGLPVKNNKVVYESVVDVTGIDKQTIYAASKKWLADNFNSSKAVIESEDKETGQIIGKGNTTATSKSNTWLLQGMLYKLDFNIQINCRDNRYRIRFYDITSNSSVGGGLLVSDVKTPLETFAFYSSQKPLKPKQQERFNSSISAINEVFTQLLENFNSSVKTYKQDDF